MIDYDNTALAVGLEKKGRGKGQKMGKSRRTVGLLRPMKHRKTNSGTKKSRRKKADWEREGLTTRRDSLEELSGGC